MTSIKSISKVLLVLAALSLTATGCERRADEPTSGGGTESSQPGSSGMSGSGSSGGTNSYGSGSGGTESR